MNAIMQNAARPSRYAPDGTKLPKQDGKFVSKIASSSLLAPLEDEKVVNQRRRSIDRKPPLKHTKKSDTLSLSPPSTSPTPSQLPPLAPIILVNVLRVPVARSRVLTSLWRHKRHTATFVVHRSTASPLTLKPLTLLLNGPRGFSIDSFGSQSGWHSSSLCGRKMLVLRDLSAARGKTSTQTVCELVCTEHSREPQLNELCRRLFV